MKTNFTLWSILFLLLLAGCRENKDLQDSPPPAQKSVPEALAVQEPGCIGCHQDIQLDAPHNFACTECHQGNNDTSDKDAAHQGFLAAPGAPASMQAVCGRCHEERVQRCTQSNHFTLNKAVNTVREHFGIEPPLSSFLEIPDRATVPQTAEELVDDLLRRQCFRCHLHTQGDQYAYVHRGKGCAACHLQYSGGRLESHAFIQPGERQCLSCHYSNHVGSDFMGSYEHDHSEEYRTPYTTRAAFVRPYGLEQHNLVPDIHQQRGLTCRDCHSSGQERIQCIDCHAPVGDRLPAHVRQEGENWVLHSVQSDRVHPIPLLKDPAHARYMDKVDCQVCHAQWAFNDGTSHFLLRYSLDAQPWEYLFRQTRPEVEEFVISNAYYGEDVQASMRDAITGQRKAGIWFKGFDKRRWEDILIRKDTDGRIKVFRPILDLRLSAADEENKIINDLDNIQGKGSGLLPYTPHTTGPAGIFYTRRFLHLLEEASEE